ncbi:MAG: hypothetical protein WBA11_06105, partial [Rubrivirga sp.]
MTRLLVLVAFAITASSSVAQAPAGDRSVLEADSVRVDTSAVGTETRSCVADPSVRIGPFPPIPSALAGVVWAAPDSTAAALEDLEAMRRVGVRQVRSGLVTDVRVLEAADRLGIAVWQDLPIKGLPASFLVRDAEEAEA